jgi:oligoribonuclease NrnB/cAMP/cGMP phosphodiesterase (DHH superfamily)
MNLAQMAVGESKVKANAAVLYHGNCYDGFGSAFSAWKKLGNSAVYYPVAYNAPVPDISTFDTVYIVDFSYPKDVMEKIADQVKKLVIIDHHKTAQQNLQDFSRPNAEKIFDMNKSGAYLTWEYFHPNTEIPQLIKHISDRDLWQFKLPGSHDIHKALVSHPMDFELWDNFDVETLKADGKICGRLHDQLVQNICKKPFLFRLGEYTIPVVNTSMAWSEVGETLYKNKADAPFVASFTVYGDKIMWSLRSVGDFDVSAVAEKFGGGGHKNAAGFKTDWDFLVKGKI